MRIVFMGTPAFAVPSLDILVKNGYEVVGVVTAPDKPAGRGQQVSKSAVKEYAEQAGLHLLQPVNLKSEEFISDLRSLRADIQIVVAFRMLPEIIWNMPPLGTWNLHASLLPDYRGAAPINWAIINGEKETGLTTFRLKHEIDTGSILLQKRIPIGENTTAGELHDIMMEKGAGLVLKTVKLIEKGNFELREQEQLHQGKELHHAPKIHKETCRIDWNKSAEEVHNLVRGLSPYPAAWSELETAEGKVLQVKIFRTKKTSWAKSSTPGEIKMLDGEGLAVGTSTGFLIIEEIQVAGKKRMKTSEFLKGFRFSHSEKFV